LLVHSLQPMQSRGSTMMRASGAAFIDDSENVRLALPLRRRAGGNRLVLDDSSCLVFLDTGSGIRHFKPPIGGFYFVFLLRENELSILVIAGVARSYAMALLTSSQNRPSCCSPPLQRRGLSPVAAIKPPPLKRRATAAGLRRMPGPK
jgi:hypothetical protein